MQSLPNSYDSQFAADNAKYFEGSFVAPQFASLEYKPLLPTQQEFLDWMGKLGKRVFEIPGYGWIDALELVHGLKLAGPNFSQQVAPGRYRLHMLAPISIVTPNQVVGRGEGMVIADCDLRAGLKAKRFFDAVGHYSRRELFQTAPTQVARLASPPHEQGGNGDG